MKLQYLQILRGISALLVCCFHFREQINFASLKLGDLLFSKGAIGVEIFFVISGFIMYFSTERTSFDQNILKNIIIFIKRRVIRIIPLYYFLTLCWVVLGGGISAYILDPIGFDRLWKSLLFLPVKGGFPVLFLGWSLNYEIFFYLLFSLSFMFRTYRYHFLIGILLILILIGQMITMDNLYYKFITNPINIYFIIGILFGFLYKKTQVNHTLRKLIFLLGMIVFSVFFWFDKTLNPILPVSLFFFSFLILDTNKNNKTAPNKFLVMLGDISYSIYLVHPFVGILFKKIVVQNDISKIIIFVLQIIIVVIISKIIYEVFEKRLTHYLKKIWLKP